MENRGDLSERLDALERKVSEMSGRPSTAAELADAMREIERLRDELRSSRVQDASHAQQAYRYRPPQPVPHEVRQAPIRPARVLDEGVLGRYLIGALATVLILCAAGVLVFYAWDSVPVQVWFAAGFLLCVVLEALSVRLSAKSRLRGFWVVMAAMAASVMLMLSAGGSIGLGLYDIGLACMLAVAWFAAQAAVSGRLASVGFYAFTCVGGLVTMGFTVIYVASDIRLAWPALFGQVDAPILAVSVPIVLLGMFLPKAMLRRESGNGKAKAFSVLSAAYPAAAYFVLIPFLSDIKYVGLEMVYDPVGVYALLLVLGIVFSHFVQAVALDAKRLRFLGAWAAPFVAFLGAVMCAGPLSMMSDLIRPEWQGLFCLAGECLIMAALCVFRPVKWDVYLLGFGFPVCMYAAMAGYGAFGSYMLVPSLLAIGIAFWSMSAVSARRDAMAAEALGPYGAQVGYGLFRESDRYGRAIRLVVYLTAVAQLGELWLGLPLDLAEALDVAGCLVLGVAGCMLFLSTYARDGVRFRAFEAMVYALTAACSMGYGFAVFVGDCAVPACLVVALAMLKGTLRRDVDRSTWEKAVCCAVYWITSVSCHLELLGEGLWAGFGPDPDVVALVICVTALFISAAHSLRYAAMSGRWIDAASGALSAYFALAEGSSFFGALGLPFSVAGVALGSMLVIIGFRTRSKHVRVTGLATILLYVLKACLFDLQSASQGPLVLSLGLLLAGVICVAVSWVYHRFGRSVGSRPGDTAGSGGDDGSSDGPAA